MDDHKSDVQDGIFALGAKNTAYQKYFKGQSYLQSLVNDPKINVSVSNVSFELGCRNNWHQHIGGFQILLAKLVRAGIKKKAKRLVNCILVM